MHTEFYEITFKPRLTDGDAKPQHFFTVDELAALVRLDRKAIYDAIRRGQIPGVRRIGKVYRISVAAFFDWSYGPIVSRPDKTGLAESDRQA